MPSLTKPVVSLVALMVVVLGAASARGLPNSPHLRHASSSGAISVAADLPSHRFVAGPPCEKKCQEERTACWSYDDVAKNARCQAAYEACTKACK